MHFYPFGTQLDHYETSAEVLGGKGAGLVWMFKQGVTVPPGFIISTDVWVDYDKKPKSTMKEIAKALPSYLAQLKNHFGYMPLLSIRSGARVSLPGMLDTILNVGLDFTTANLWKQKLGNECYVDSCHRLVTMYGSVVKDLSRQELEQGSLEEALALYTRKTGEEFPTAQAQLLSSIEAVFKSWDNDHALVFRKQNNIPREWGTAVVVQAMVFGNFNSQSASGVLFTRNPDTGERKVQGEWYPNVQGEDVVNGSLTPFTLSEMEKWNKSVYDELLSTVTNLEALRKDIQDVEFTVQDGKLYLLQTRNGKRSAQAAIRIAVEMEKEGLITKAEAVKRVSPKQFDIAQLARLDPTFKGKEAYTGIPACSGVVTGKPVFSAEAAINCKVPCILVTEETTPEDISGMLASVGVITMKGGLTSHAAVVARGENVPCITGVGQSVDSFKVDVVSMDGATGRIWLEKIPIGAGEKNGLISSFSKLLFEAVGVVPIITDIPTESMDEALLYLGTRMINAEEAAYFVAKVATKVGRLYVDFTVADGPETDFLNICKDFDPAQKVVEFLEGFVDDTEGKYSSVAEKLVLVGPVVTSYFKMIGVGNDLRSLVLADKELLMSVAVSNDPAIEKVIAWRVKEGLNLVSVGRVVPGVKSMLSLGQCLQVAQKGV